MTDFSVWAARHPQAAQEFIEMISGQAQRAAAETDTSEAWAQQQVRFKCAQHFVVDRNGNKIHGMSWRNNVGATPVKCKQCGAKQTPVRYGLANDSPKVNKVLKSHDVIGVIPRLIRPRDVGSVIGQFASVEVKRPGWKYTGRGTEEGQARWAALISRAGGYSTFSTGELEL